MARESCVSGADSAAAALFAWVRGSAPALGERLRGFGDPGAPGVCGANSYGQLGLGHREDVLLPQQLSNFCEPGCIKSVTGGGGHSAAVTDGGSLFVCGLNKDGQLGLGHTEDVLCFTICKPLLGCPILQVACGWDFTIMLTETGQVLSCGSNAFGQLGVPHGPRRCVVPQAIELLREKVVCVAAGLRHALATTVSGSVFQWGTGLASSGRRLCPGQTLPLFLTAKEPSRVTGLENSTAVCVVAGSEHSASLTDTGELFVWGRNKNGQLASLAAFVLLPQRIDACCFQDEKVTAIWSGWTHLVAQTETGKMFTWGRADYGQLGRRLESPEGQKPHKQDSQLTFRRPQSSVPLPLRCLTGAAKVTSVVPGAGTNMACVEMALSPTSGLHPQYRLFSHHQESSLWAVGLATR
ncbi:secretion-regulating guanine nucleotide exchange factor isoform X3 [Mesocricetus auratus]|uniref:Secretion-regulating guanine nucleotide exchange factor isoform X3 n=1 Tax=Mesocricetus auratus TaxID=10036 RepID=A0ABM2WMJ7_MESAU|nr:secretion-regulating guanine nucleotide exchange factor isoform X3 [Mesocricetus auratus]